MDAIAGLEFKVLPLPFPRLVSNSKFSCLCLLNSCDYKHTPPHLMLTKKSHLIMLQETTALANKKNSRKMTVLQ
jgi:hypothetical protein